MSDDRPRWRRTPEQRPAQILAAATSLYADQGYEATDMREVAQQAGVSVGTVYRYFASKPHVLDAIHHQFHVGLEDCFQAAVDRLVDQQPAPDVATAADMLVEEMVGYLTERAAQHRVVATYVPRVHAPDEADEHEHGFIDLMAQLLRAGVEAGTIATSDPQMTAHLFYYAIRDTLSSCLVFDDPPDLERLIGQIKELCTKALAP